MSNSENVLVEGKHVGIIKIISILLIAFHIMFLFMKISSLMWVNSEIRMETNYYLVQNWYAYRTEVIIELSELVGAIIIFVIILCWLGLAKITVTNKRVYGSKGS